MAKIITIRQSEKDTDLKDMIARLKSTKGGGVENIYYDRSESDIAKMILEEPLIKEFKRIISSK